MNRETDSPAVALLAFVYPFLSTLAPVLFFHNLFRDEFLFPGIYLLIQILFIVAGILFFNPFCRKNLYEFEDLGHAFTDRFIFAIFLFSLLAALSSVRFKPSRLYLAVPLMAALIQTYMIVLFQSLRYNSIGGIVRLSYTHIGKSLGIVLFIILLKTVMILILPFLGLPQLKTSPALAGFVSDILMVIFLRKQLYQLEMEKEGFSEDQIRDAGPGSAAPLVVPALTVSFLFLRDRAVPGPEILLRLYRWLSSFSFSFETGEAPVSFHEAAGPAFEELEALQSLWETRKIEFELIRKIFDILGYILLGFIAVLVLYFILYPIFAPLFFRKRQNPTFREYYSTILKALLRFFRSIRSFFTAIGMIGQQRISGQEESSSAFNYDQIKGEPYSPAKKAELVQSRRIYRKLQKHARRRLEISSLSTVPVEDFFSLIESKSGSIGPSCLILAPLFNRSFFSATRLDRDEIKILKEESSRIMKEL
ncbi:MAG: hypothetical protein JXR86_03275 [Spirochaetales bacterium]|nr:hypothetical protein [Spirochaetales bacterium]